MTAKTLSTLQRVANSQLAGGPGDVVLFTPGFGAVAGPFPTYDEAYALRDRARKATGWFLIA